MSAYLPIYLQLLLIALYYRLSHALFEGCDYRYKIEAGDSFLESPYYPNFYPPSTSCRYQFLAPVDHTITVDCTISLEKNPTTCSTEFFYVARDGDIQLRNSEQFCGNGNIVRTSQFNIMTLAYVSYGQKGRFRCKLTATPQPCDCGWSATARITNGQEAAVNEFPSMVAIKDRESNLASFCGGAILTHRDVLTAAHCIFFQPNPNRLVIIVGDHTLTSSTDSRYSAEYNVDSFVVHPNFNSETNTNDIGIIRTATDIEWSRGVGPICLPPANSPTLNYEFVTLMGWGTSSFGGIPASSLQKINQLVLPNANCQSQYENLAVINSGHICTYDYTGNAGDTCQYDSGGPVILRKSRQFLVGCISFGRGCGYSQNPVGINSRISFFIPWINSQLTATACAKPFQ